VDLWGTQVPLGEVQTHLPRMRTRLPVERLTEDARRLPPSGNVAVELVPANPGDAMATQYFLAFAAPPDATGTACPTRR